MALSEWEKEFKTKNVDILEKCQAMGRELNMNASALSAAWDEFRWEKKLPLTQENLQKFRTKELKSVKGEVRVKREEKEEGEEEYKKTILGPGRGSTSMEVDEVSGSGGVNVKKRGRASVLSEAKANSSFSKRTERAKVIRTFAGVECAKWTGRKYVGVEIKLESAWQGLKEPYAWNYNWESEVKEYLEKRVETVAAVILANQGLAEPVAGASRQETYTSVGMLVSGGEDEGALDARDVYLANFRSKPVRLDLLDVPDRALFRGQVVVVRGTNPQDRRIKVETLHTAAAPDPRTFTEGTNVLRSRELHVMMAAGPFTTSEDLSYEPLTELLRQVKLRAPNVLLLLGPFVDVAHPHVAHATTPHAYHTLFDDLLATLHSLLSSLGPSAPHLLLIPSLRDVHHPSVLPQPSFPPSPLHAPSAHLFPNPSTFSLNSLFFGVSSTDILSDLRPNALFDGSYSLDPLSSLTASILQQRSFYPLFPPPKHVPIDMLHAHQALSIPFNLDLLLFVSSSPPFAQQIGSTLGVNIGSLISHDNLPGTYAELKIAQSDPSSTSLIQRSQIEIIRI